MRFFQYANKQRNNNTHFYNNIKRIIFRNNYINKR